MKAMVMKAVLTCLALTLSSTGAAVAQNTDQPPPADPLTVKPVDAQTQTADADQIRVKIEHVGYTDIQDLSRDRMGVWHARAKKDNEVVDIAIDKGGRIKPALR